MRKRTARAGFTLLEMLVAVAIIGVLASLVVLSAGPMLSMGDKAREVGAAKSLAAAYLLYPVDNDGQLMPGVSDKHPAEDHSGLPVAGYLGRRWPYRLGPYFDYEYAGVAVVNEAEESFNEHSHNPWLAEYMATVGPSFGINSTHVGGNYTYHHGEPRVDTNPELNGSLCVTRLGQAVNPGRLIVFASAYFKPGGGTEPSMHGNYYILGPHRWSGNEWNEEAPSGRSGHVHFRYNDAAVVVHLDGSVRVLTYDQMRDPTRWSNQAALEAGPTYTQN